MLFWMVVILGYRRQRNFERVFFFLCRHSSFSMPGSLLAAECTDFLFAAPQSVNTFAAVLIAWAHVLPPVLFHCT